MIANTLRTALQAIGANKLRSVLTMLGIILGVGSVIVMLAVGAGAQAHIQDEIRALGANVMVLVSGTVNSAGAQLGAGTRPTVTAEDGYAIKSEIPSVAAASPTVRGTAQAVAGNNNWTTNIQGVSADFFVVREWRAAAGRVLDEDEAKTARKVAVLGRTVAQKLFPDADPVGQVMRINKVPFTVVGVLAAKGQSAGAVDQDDIVALPLDAARNRVLGRNAANPRAVSGVLIKIQDGADMNPAADQIRRLIRQRHNLEPGGKDDFTVRNLSDLMQARESASRTMTLFLAAVAAVSLLVGGIGIMNIMLVSVTERTREIGLRMAVGARRRDILAQFLVEAVVLSLIGGLIGLALGLGGSIALSTLARLRIAIDPDAALISLLFAALVGVFFGFYPARRAALLQPIDALRYE